MKQWILTPDKYLKDPELKQLRSFMEDKALAAQAREHNKPIRDWAIIDIALSAGLRASEIRTLRLKDLHLGKGMSAIYVAKGKGG